MEIVCAGTINRDIVEFADGRRSESLGGLVYSIMALAVLSPGSGRIIPVVNAGKDIYNSVTDELGRFRQIDLEGLHKCDCPNNAVYLCLQEGRERDEHTDLHLPRIEYHQFEPYLDSGALMLNFASGFEMDFATARRIIDAFQGIVYMDIHSLTLGIDDNRHRIRRTIPEGLNWIDGVDFVQATEEEIRSFFREDERDLGIDVAGRRIADRCRKACFVTRGSRGVRVYTKEGMVEIEPEKIENVIDTTGCGDVFGAAFLISYLENGEVIKAAEFGNKAAALKCGMAGFGELGGLKNLPGAM